MNIQKVFFIICCFFSLQLSYAQDTIVKRNGDKVLAKVIEVGETIRYKRIDIPDGPTYSINKSDVSMIIYKGGNRDLFDVSVVPPVNVAPQTIMVAPEEPRLEVNGRRYEYGNRRISESRMLNIAKRHDTNSKLLNEIELTRSSRRNQYVTGWVGGGCFIVGGYSALFALLTSVGTGTPNPTLTGLAIGGIVGGIALQVASFYFKSERVSHAHRVVDLYNQTILN
jgi:hypothetical protein